MATTSGRFTTFSRAVALATALAVVAVGCTGSPNAFDDGQPTGLASTADDQGSEDSAPVPDDLLPSPDLPEPAPAIEQARGVLNERPANDGDSNDGNASGEASAPSGTSSNDGYSNDGYSNDGYSNDGYSGRRVGGVEPEDELLSQFDPLDGKPTPGEHIGLRDGLSRNGAGELRQLDQSASLACGDVEVAITALDEGDSDGAKDRMNRAADRAAASGVDGMAPWADALSDGARTGDAAVMIAFLSACTEGGYEL